MKERKYINLKLSTAIFIIVLVLIVIIAIGLSFFIINFNNKKEENTNKVNNLNIEDKKENNIPIEEDNNNQANLIELPEDVKLGVYNNIIEDKALLQTMVLKKDFSVPEFQDEDIIKVLPNLDPLNYFIREDDIAKISIENAQRLAQAYFGRDIDTSKLEEKIEDDTIYVEIDTGYGIVEYEYVDLRTVDVDKYALDIKYIGDDRVTVYTLTIRNVNGYIVFDSLEDAFKKEIVEE